jgi:hypothetical protein
MPRPTKDQAPAEVFSEWAKSLPKSPHQYITNSRAASFASVRACASSSGVNFHSACRISF